MCMFPDLEMNIFWEPHSGIFARVKPRDPERTIRGLTPMDPATPAMRNGIGPGNLESYFGPLTPSAPE